MLTPWTVRTGIKPVDKLIHESEEALHYYHLLPEGTSPRSLHSPLQQTIQDPTVGGSRREAELFEILPGECGPHGGQTGEIALDAVSYASRP